jgi:hypothetical protein
VTNPELVFAHLFPVAVLGGGVCLDQDCAPLDYVVAIEAVVLLEIGGRRLLLLWPTAACATGAADLLDDLAITLLLYLRR